MKRVSIIVPVYKVAAFITECANSLFSQTYENIEFIFIDDCTPDNSIEILQESIKLYPNRKSQTTIISQEKNQGQAAARNKGIEIASGDYITFVDSDDFYTNERIIADAVSILESDKTISFVQIPYIKDGKIHGKKNEIVSELEDMYKLWINGKTITNYFCDKVFRKETFGELRFKHGIIFEDRYLFPSILNRCGKIALCSNIGSYFYRTHASQTTQRNDSHALSCQIIADMRILELIPAKLKAEALTVYWRAISNSIASHNHSDIADYDFSFTDAIGVNIPLGIKIRLCIIKLIGLKNYLKLTDR